MVLSVVDKHERVLDKNRKIGFKNALGVTLQHAILRHNKGTQIAQHPPRVRIVTYSLRRSTSCENNQRCIVIKYEVHCVNEASRQAVLQLLTLWAQNLKLAREWGTDVLQPSLKGQGVTELFIVMKSSKPHLAQSTAPTVSIYGSLLLQWYAKADTFSSKYITAIRKGLLKVQARAPMVSISQPQLVRAGVLKVEYRLTSQDSSGMAMVWNTIERRSRDAVVLAHWDQQVLRPLIAAQGLADPLPAGFKVISASLPLSMNPGGGRGSAIPRARDKDGGIVAFRHQQ
jgi:hypothetical protein